MRRERISSGTIRRMRRVILVAALVAACGGKKDDAKPEAKKPEAAKPSAPEAKPTPPPVEVVQPAAPPGAAANTLVEHDLSSQGGAWAGWTVKAPADGKLEANDGTVKGGIAIRWGNGEGAMGFAQKKIDFKAVKHDFEVAGDTVVDKETADQLDATMTMAGTKLRCFYQNRTIAGTTVACWTVSCVMDDAALARAHAICDSLAKK